MKTSRSRPLGALAIGVTIALSLSANCSADTIYVATDGSDVSPDPTNSATPLASITAGVDAAKSGDTVWIGAGTYTAMDVNIDKNLELVGDHTGDTVVEAAATPGVAGGRVFLIPPQVTVEVKLITIRNGFSQQIGLDFSGGGIFNQGELTLDKVYVEDNTSGVGGMGGGIYNQGKLVVRNSTITGNMTGTGGFGGGIYNAAGGDLDIYDSTISENVTGDGAANPAGLGGIAGYGGGVFNAGDLFANRTLFYKNTTGDGGTGQFGGFGGFGGGIGNTGSAVVHCSTISENCTGAGGIGSTSNGTAGSGGGFDSTNAPFVLGFTTIVYNKTATGGPGAGGHNNSAFTGVVTHDSIFYNNTASSGADFGGTLTSSGYNIIGDTGFFTVGGDLTGNTDLDPLLGPLADNGGPTMTYALLHGSPAMDGGNPSPTDPPPTDQRGYTRKDSRVDIGAFEYDACPPQIDLKIGKVTIVDGEIHMPIEASVIGVEYTLRRTDDFTQPVEWELVAGQTDVPGTGGLLDFVSATTIDAQGQRFYSVSAKYEF